MFNSKLKQRITELETANKQLQEQYNLVYVMLQARQDDCVALQRELAAKPEPSYRVFIDKLKMTVREKLPFLSDRVLIEVGDELMKVVCDEFGVERLMVHDHSDPDDSDEDEDEDEEYDD
jgi:hypothetical protein